MVIWKKNLFYVQLFMIINYLKIQKMERTIQTKFYEFNQNNSGGHFDVDENVCHRVIIEAMDEKHAVALFEPMIDNTDHYQDRQYHYLASRPLVELPADQAGLQVPHHY